MVLPYLKGFLYISCVHCYGEWFWCLFLLFSKVYLHIWYIYITFGIIALSLGKKRIIFGYFLQKCFIKKGGRISGSYMRHFSQNFQKVIEYLDSSQKNTQFQKQNQSKQSPGSKVMSILNSIVFQGFSRKDVIFYSKLFLTLVFVEDFSQEICFLLEIRMTLVLNNS
jgi:hypothetical protein